MQLSPSLSSAELVDLISCSPLSCRVLSAGQSVAFNGRLSVQAGHAVLSFYGLPTMHGIPTLRESEPA